MIPPLVLDVKPGMTVLDLCAAPGSKSAQLIEMVHGGEENRMKKILRKMKIAEGCEASPDGGAMEREAEDTELEGDWADDGRATGLLVANDVDYKRAHMLIHQMKRLNSPNLIVTNHDATMFPSIKLPSEPRADGGAARGKYLKFDRILADVPCSGDGTSRKNVNVWKDWSPSNALGLFTTQVRILVRALQILKVGGRVVYSTCSMNPVENEAVVATAIDRCGGLNKVNVIDCSDRITALKRSPGLKSWIVMDKQGAIWKTWANVEEQKQKNGPDGLGRLAEGMFTPDDTCEQIPFERCMRVYGHQQDTGAFFITVLEKRSEIRARPETAPRIKRNEVPEDGDAFVEDINAPTMVVEKHESKPEKELEPVEHITVPLGSIHNITANSVEKDAVPQSDNVTIISPNGVNPLKHDLNDEPEAPPSSKRSRLDDDAQEQSSEGRTQAPLKTSAATLAYDPLRPINGVKRNNGQQFEEPFKYLDPHHPELENIYKFYKIHPQFPKDRFMVRNAMGHPAKTIYYTTALARDILNENEGKGLKFIHCGVKMFVKQDVQREDVCRWRIQTDGLPILESWVGEERVVRLNSKKTLRSLLVEMFPKVDGMGWQELGEIGERVRDIDMGCCVLRVETGTGDDSFRYCCLAWPSPIS
jgi:multisite-specific tRNA:(cytosine-C5)-methyltransferase